MIPRIWPFWPSNHVLNLCSGTKTSVSKKEQQEKEREHAKRRKQKKLERFKNMEKEGEKGKNKWQNFSTKASIIHPYTVICGYSDSFPTGFNCSRT